MITIQYKLYPTPHQTAFLNEALWSSIGIYNWAVKQIQSSTEHNFPLFLMGSLQLRSILSGRIKGHSKRCGLSSALINYQIQHAIASHICNKKIGKRTKLKGFRNKKSFQFGGDIKFDEKLRIKLPGLKTTIKTHKEVPLGRPKKMVLVRKCSGWYCSVVFDGNRAGIDVTGVGEIGIDPGLRTSLTTSDGGGASVPAVL